MRKSRPGERERGQGRREREDRGRRERKKEGKVNTKNEEYRGKEREGERVTITHTVSIICNLYLPPS